MPTESWRSGYVAQVLLHDQGLFRCASAHEHAQTYTHSAAIACVISMASSIVHYATQGLNNLEFHSQPWLQSLSFISVTILLLLSCIPPLHVPVRNMLRPTVVYHVEQGLLRVHQAQRLEHWLLTLLFDLSSRTVSVPFYITFLPSLIWSGEAELGTRLVLLMGLCLYVGNAMKDLLSAPRPFGAEYKSNKVKLIGPTELEANINAQVSPSMSLLLFYTDIITFLNVTR